MRRNKLFSCSTLNNYGNDNILSIAGRNARLLPTESAIITENCSSLYLAAIEKCGQHQQRIMEIKILA
jgi:hypothetical protein